VTAGKPWVYRVTVPADQADDVVLWLTRRGLGDEEHLIVLEEGDGA
jgi:hypothetical protein